MKHDKIKDNNRRNAMTTMIPRRARLCAVACLAPAVMLGSAAAEDCEPYWDTSIGQPGMSGFVHAMTVFDDGSGPALYAGGSFNTAGGQTVNRIARWDGEEWSPLGPGVSGGVVWALTVFDDGTGPALYAAGTFHQAGGQEASRIAKWDGEQWSEVGGGIQGNFVYELTVLDPEDGEGPALYVGGAFQTAGDVNVTRLAKWDGEEWTALGHEWSFDIRAITTFDGGTGPLLHAAGQFSQPYLRIARRAGGNWFDVGGGMNSSIFALKVFDDGSGDALYAGGHFTEAGGTSTNRIAMWNGMTWSPLGTGTDERVHSMESFDYGAGTALYVGGRFSWAGGVQAERMARWDGNEWSSLEANIDDGQNNNATVRAIQVFDDGTGPALYIGGRFNEVAGEEANHIAVWRCPPQEPTPGDLTGNGTVGEQDLLILFSAWGECPESGDCPADLNGDGFVDGLDLLILLSNWG